MVSSRPDGRPQTFVAAVIVPHVFQLGAGLRIAKASLIGARLVANRAVDFEFVEVLVDIVITGLDYIEGGPVLTTRFCDAMCAS